ncbi:hypothetical protein DACRYDRAFT_117890 [Dacryopinax primogenitus]|uniref:Sc15 protein n=1 Tax=Dacryopinax primogenitus (strain DJM 731) TaxID=1858805 RepID=M5G7H3_DACPD|nr:uncharacterized protein DACRYDRAFT_117890 [Dacryopinax primogenitus]EJT99707.1 hypothetical protein DACRYDRAFT_117890 [Dacryopinax primogenitus]
MQLIRFSAFLAGMFALCNLGLAHPALTKGQADQSQITSIMDTLQSTVESAVGSLNGIDPSTATLAQVQPYVTDIEDAFSTAASALSSLNSSGRKRSSVTDVQGRQTAFEKEIAQLVAGLLTDVTNSLTGLLSVQGLGAILPNLDGPLNQTLLGLETLLAGVLNLVSGLLVDVAGLLTALGWGLTLATLGL